MATALRGDLDLGEAKTIALEPELKADLVLLDEREGRRAAKWLGLRVVGVVAILLDAKARGTVRAVQPHLDALRQTAGFYVADAVCDDALSLAEKSERAISRLILSTCPGS